MEAPRLDPTHASAIEILGEDDTQYPTRDADVNFIARSRGLVEELANLAQESLDNLAMANGCLQMIREELEGFGVDMSKTPPMMYNDAIAVLVSRMKNLKGA